MDRDFYCCVCLILCASLCKQKLWMRLCAGIWSFIIAWLDTVKWNNKAVEWDNTVAKIWNIVTFLYAHNFSMNVHMKWIRFCKDACNQVYLCLSARNCTYKVCQCVQKDVMFHLLWDCFRYNVNCTGGIQI